MISNLYQRRMIERRKENNLCTNCGKPLDREGTSCIECRNKINKEVRDTRNWYQSHGICPRCRRNKLYGTEKNCPECAARAYISAMKTRDNEKYNRKHAEWSKRTHQEMIDKGICTRCRKRNADGGYKTCEICRAKGKQYKRMKYGKPNRQERHLQGLCYFCDNPIKQGYKVCEHHYQMNIEKSNCQKAKEVRKDLIDKKILY